LREPTWLVRPRRHHEKLAIDPDDWLLPEDKAEVDAISDWSAKHSRSQYLAGQRLAEWSAHIGKTAPLAPSETQEWFNFEGGVGNLAVLLAVKGLQVSRVAALLHAGSARSSTQQSAGANAPLPQAWATSTNWIAQAALAVSEFEAQAQREWDPKKREAIAVNVVRQHAGHAAAAIRGLAVSGTFRGILGSSYEVRKALGVLAQVSPEAARALKYVDDTHNGLFVRGVYDDSIDERAATEEAAEERNAEQEAAAQRVIEPLSRELKELSRKVQLGQTVTTWGFLILAGTLFFLRSC
jgi:hypothetical protein